MPIEWIVGRSAALYSWDYTSGVLGQLLPASAILPRCRFTRDGQRLQR